MKIQIISDAMAVTPEGEDSRDVVGEELKLLDGVDCQERFTEYFHERFTIGEKVHDGEQDLIDAGITGGYMRFRYDDRTNELNVITEYDVTRKLTYEEAKHLVEYTQGQWSDGIGETFEQNPVEIAGVEYFISPWYPGQMPEIRYVNE